MRRTRPGLDLSIVGAGVSPSTVSLRALADLLRVAASLLESVANEHELTLPPIALTQVRKGSAAYEVTASREQDDAIYSIVVRNVYTAIGERGAKQGPDVRRNLSKLHEQASSLGSLRVRAKRLVGVVTPQKPIIMAPPLDAIPSSIQGTRVIHGRVVGVEAQEGGKLVVRIKPEAGARVRLEASESVAAEAARLFNRGTRAKVLSEWNDHGERRDTSLVSLEAWDGVGTDLFDVLADVRQQLIDEGVNVSLEEFERNRRGEPD